MSPFDFDGRKYKIRSTKENTGFEKHGVNYSFWELPSLFVFILYSMFKPEVLMDLWEELMEGTVTCVFTAHLTKPLNLFALMELHSVHVALSISIWAVRVCICLKREIVSTESCFRAYSMMSHCVRMWISEYDLLKTDGEVNLCAFYPHIAWRNSFGSDDTLWYRFSY